jgi:hypothetical protein
MLRSTVVIVALALLSAPALAKKPKKVAPAKAPAVPTANEKAVSEIQGAWQWGMTVDEVLAILHRQLAEKAAPELAKLSDVYEQTRIRKGIKAEVDQVRSTLIKFEGQRTGWDVSIIEGEFMHRNGESMMLLREIEPQTGRDQQRFFFFKDGRLWKQFIAFNMEPYIGKTFDDFRKAMESRYGAGMPITRKDREGNEKLVAVGWRAGGTTLRAIDLMRFYSNFCLAFSDESVERAIEAERQARAPKPAPVRASVEPAAEEKIFDPNADVIDRITAPDNTNRTNRK